MSQQGARFKFNLPQGLIAARSIGHIKLAARSGATLCVCVIDQSCHWTGPSSLACQADRRPGATLAPRAPRQCPDGRHNGPKAGRAHLGSGAAGARALFSALPAPAISAGRPQAPSAPSINYRTPILRPSERVTDSSWDYNWRPFGRRRSGLAVDKHKRFEGARQAARRATLEPKTFRSARPTKVALCVGRGGGSCGRGRGPRHDLSEFFVNRPHGRRAG